MARVVVTGASSPLGRRVVERLAALDETTVVAADLRSPEVPVPGAEHRVLDLVTADLSSAFADADAVLHLASVFGPRLDGPEVTDAVEVTIARRVFGAADKAGVGQLVVLSSAAVYGPWPNNPVPLTEDAPLRPHPDLPFAVQKAEVERLAADWAIDHPGATVARLRPAPVTEDGRCGWFAEALAAASDVPVGDDVAAQYLHVDDLAAAVVAVWRSGIDGPVNVAPDGWLTPNQRRALDPVPRLRVPEPVAVKLSSWRWRLRLAPTPPGILAHARHPWVVANDRLAAVGWSAVNSNEEAYVAGHEASAIESITPRRRQELALAVAGVGIAGAVGGLVAGIRRAQGRRGNP